MTKTRIFGTAVELDGVGPALIEFSDGVITKFTRVSEPPSGVKKYDLNDFIIFPGFIDIHTHCREDASKADIHKESYATAGLAALNGGVTFIADMPNNPTAPITTATYAAKKKLAAKCPVDVLLYAGIGPETTPFDATIPYKCFMGPSIGELYFKNNLDLSEAIRHYEGLAVSFHCEDPVLLDHNSTQPTHEQRRPPACEIEAIEFAIELISKYKIKGKICHVSTPAGLDLINRARHSGISISAEVTPHHLYFDCDNIVPDKAKFLQMNPPLRTSSDRLSMLRSVHKDLLEYLASDHAPHTTTEKMNGISGVPELDTYGPFVAWLLKAQKLHPITALKMCCVRPGAWIGSFTGRKIGRLQPGYEASIAVLNFAKSAADCRRLYTKCGWSPFDLRSLPGVVQTVYLKGEKVIDGEYVKNFNGR